MFILGIIQFVIMCYITITEFNKKSPVVFMWSTLLLMFGFMHMLNTFSGDYEYTDSIMNFASLFVIGFCTIYEFVRLITQSKSKKLTNKLKIDCLRERLKEDNFNGSLVLFLFVLFLLLKTIPYLVYVGDIFSTSWATGRNYSATLGYLNIEQITRIFIYSLSGIGAIFLIKGDKRWIPVFFLIIVDVILTRNRIEILPLFCSLIAYYIFKRNSITLKTIIATLIIGIIVLYIVYGLRVFRHYGSIDTFMQSFNFMDFNERIMLYITTDNGELGLRRVFYYFINGDNQFESFGQLHTYLRMLLVYIPTTWSFGIKPPDFAIAMGKAIGMAEGGSTHPTLFGDCYANFGVFGILLGAFWAVYANIIDSIISKVQIPSFQVLLFILNSVAFVIIGRGSVYNAFWLAAYGIPLLLFFKWLFLHIKPIRIIFGK